MKLTTITDASLINIKTTFNNRDEAIRALAEQLNQQGKLHNLEEYLDAVFAREAHGATALGEGLAVPHGKTDAVKEAAFAVATLTEDVKWPGIDEDDDEEDVNLIFLIAIPNAEAGSTHMHLLTALTSTLVDDDVREAVLNASSAEEILAIFDAESEEDAPVEPEIVKAKVNQPNPVPAPSEQSEPSSFFGKVAGWFKS